jgi:hypothetical protein
MTGNPLARQYHETLTERERRSLHAVLSEPEYDYQCEPSRGAYVTGLILVGLSCGATGLLIGAWLL